MITLYTGLTGSGKTWLMTNHIYKEWKQGEQVFANYQINFSEDNERVNRFHNLDETYYLEKGIIAIDEGQKLFDARRWASLPITFAEKIAQHRKHFLDIYTTSQSIGHIDIRIRDNVHEWFHVVSLLRLPRNERVKPILQINKVIKKTRLPNNDGLMLWKVEYKKTFFISRYWTKEIYDTYADVGFERHICKIKREKKQWKAKIYNRELCLRGKARL